MKKEREFLNVGYAFRSGLVVEDLALDKITHLNYSFGLIYNREIPPNPDDELMAVCETPKNFDDSLLHTIYLHEDSKVNLKKLSKLKAEKNPDLKIMLSVGGAYAMGFSEAAATDKSRMTFAKSCKSVLDEYDLDGIDLDWEYPSVSLMNIKSTPEDTKNFTLLLEAVRQEIGNNKLLTIAGSANLGFSDTWTEFEKIVEILDFINIMTYDFRFMTCYYDSPLYASKKWPTLKKDDDYSTDLGIQTYLKNGCPPEKINMGLVYYGAFLPELLRETEEGKVNWELIERNVKDSGFYDSDEPELKKIKLFFEDKEYTRKDGTTFRFDKKWDEDACVSYIATYNEEGEEVFVMGYIDEKGLAVKLDYIKKHNLGGAMFWQFGLDYDNLLTTQIAEEFNI